MWIPTEDNYCDWLVAGVKGYFKDRGLRAQSFSIGQVAENKFPFDRAFGVGNKIIGFQLKRPVGEDPWTWALDVTSAQHRLLKGSQWVLYALPDFIDVSLQDVALHHFRFAFATDVSLASA